MKITSLLPLLFTAALCFAISYQLPEAQASSEIIVLKAAHLFDGVSGKLTDRGVVIVEGDKIKEVGTDLNIPNLPQGAKIIDLGNATLLPGFIDSHVHLGYDYLDDWYKVFYKSMLLFPAEKALHGADNARRTLEAGFTTVRDLGSDDHVAVSLRNAIKDQLVPGPRMLVSNYAIGATGGHADSPPFPPELIPSRKPENGICNSPDECRAAVRYQIKYGADVIKFMPSGGVLSLTDSVDSVQLTQEEMNAIVSESHTLGRKVAAHCHGDLAAKMAIKAGTDSIEHGTFLKDDTLLLMKKKGVYLVPTLFTVRWLKTKLDTVPPVIRAKILQAENQHTEMFKHALSLGVLIAFGTDAAVEPHGLNAHEFALMTENGMTPANALLAATTKAAHLLGIDDTTGSLSVGKDADIIALPGNPLEDIHATEHPVLVMRAGRIQLQPK